MAAGQGQARAEVELWLDETAALTLQTVMLQALVSKGLLTAQEAPWCSAGAMRPQLVPCPGAFP
jgi:hypothetical protein